MNLKMGNIKILDKDTVDKIAAGEVIERPASIVKELIENSLDACADNIVIEVSDGGKRLVKVVDNGLGMSKEDLKKSILRHATSKLKDLFNIKTLGFRGEALSSIAAVSHLSISTDNGQENLAIEVVGGELKSEKDVGIAQGTIVEVEDIFFNTPARKKYLKGRDVELGHIIDIVTRYSLANKNVSFKLISDGKEILNVPKTDNLLNKIVSIYGKDIARNMIDVEYSDDFCSIKGYIGKPYVARKDKDMQSIFVNKRYVKCDTVSKALYDAFHTLLFLDRHPVAILDISIDFSLTDVNVHPTKDIIRIEKEDELYKFVFEAVRNTLSSKGLIPEVDAENVTSSISSQNYNVEKGKQTLLSQLSEERAEENFKWKENVKKEFKKESVEGKIGPVIIIGQLNRMYILAEGRDGLLIIDQHAAEERVNFEKFLKQKEDNSIETQKLLKPLMIELGVAQYNTLLSNIDILKNLGFDIDDYGNNTIIIREVPNLIALPTKEFIIDLITDISKIKESIDYEKEEKIARFACRKSVKAGKELSIVQMEKIIRNLEVCDKPFSCPHGRPTIINLTLADLEKKFNRTA